MTFITNLKSHIIIVTILLLFSCNKTQKNNSENEFCANIHRRDRTTLSKESNDVA